MQSYEKENYLQVLLQEILSEDDDESVGDTYLLDEYVADSDASETSTDSFAEPPKKKKYSANKKLKVGEAAAAESNSDIIIQKWKDRGGVLMLSTRYGDEMITVKQRGKELQKPKNVFAYNKYKSHIDMSGQMKSYKSPLRKSKTVPKIGNRTTSRQGSSKCFYFKKLQIKDVYNHIQRKIHGLLKIQDVF
ncbi:hypothetical protein ILUMI_05658 [Ignelater luminosus]|uniref:PiggyBac transposable element-derived protein domain-containing protein n=1 Tax=Ignelater luminosus TaxID=2038154 RepID=A0A8K0GIH0_IGNLU|nr:hypothetical protein ILUMI_05658 [Ignelater luminosus]